MNNPEFQAPFIKQEPIEIKIEFEEPIEAVTELEEFPGANPGTSLPSWPQPDYSSTSNISENNHDTQIPQIRIKREKSVEDTLINDNVDGIERWSTIIVKQEKLDDEEVSEATGDEHRKSKNDGVDNTEKWSDINVKHERSREAIGDEATGNKHKKLRNNMADAIKKWSAIRVKEEKLKEAIGDELMDEAMGDETIGNEGEDSDSKSNDRDYSQAHIVMDEDGKHKVVEYNLKLKTLKSKQSSDMKYVTELPQTCPRGTSKMKIHQCPICIKTYTFKAWKDHMKSMHMPGKFGCDYCGKEFRCKKYLGFHIDRVHINVKKVKCDICGQLLGSAAYVKVHKQKVHAREDEEVNCDLCYAVFKCKAYLANHKKLFHFDYGTRHHCGCGKHFRTPYQLKLHKQTSMKSKKGDYLLCMKEY